MWSKSKLDWDIKQTLKPTDQERKVSEINNFDKFLFVYTFIKEFGRKFFDKMAKQIRSKNLIENKEKYGLIWFDLESISRPIDKLRVKAKTLCENQLTEIKTEHQGSRNW